jgi:hypothetical protein
MQSGKKNVPQKGIEPVTSEWEVSDLNHYARWSTLDRERERESLAAPRTHRERERCLV